MSMSCDEHRIPGSWMGTARKRNAQLCALWLHGVGTEDMGDGMC